MQIKLSLRQAVLSSLIFGGVLLALASVDARVRERVGDVVSGGDGLSPWGDRIGDLGGALATAVRHQSIENAPLLVFAAVGAVLFVFMVGRRKRDKVPTPGSNDQGTPNSQLQTTSNLGVAWSWRWSALALDLGVGN